MNPLQELQLRREVKKLKLSQKRKKRRKRKKLKKPPLQKLLKPLNQLELLLELPDPQMIQRKLLLESFQEWEVTNHIPPLKFVPHQVERAALHSNSFLFG